MDHGAALLSKRGRYKPAPGWGLFALQVLAATALLAVFLMWAASSFEWLGPAVRDARRVLVLALVLLASAAIYFGALWAAGVKPRQLLGR